MIPKFGDLHAATAASGTDCDCDLAATPGYYWRVTNINGGHDSVGAAALLNIIHDYAGTPVTKSICYVTSAGPLPMDVLFEGDTGKGVRIRMVDATSNKVLLVTAIKIKSP